MLWLKRHWRHKTARDHDNSKFTFVLFLCRCLKPNYLPAIEYGFMARWHWTVIEVSLPQMIAGNYRCVNSNESARQGDALSWWRHKDGGGSRGEGGSCNSFGWWCGYETGREDESCVHGCSDRALLPIRGDAKSGDRQHPWWQRLTLTPPHHKDAHLV